MYRWLKNSNISIIGKIASLFCHQYSISPEKSKVRRLGLNLECFIFIWISSCLYDLLWWWGWWSMLTTLNMTGSQWSYRRKVQQDALGKVNRVKEIRRRGKDGLKINRQQHFVRKRVLFLCVTYTQCYDLLCSLRIHKTQHCGGKLHKLPPEYTPIQARDLHTQIPARVFHANCPVGINYYLITVTQR